MIPIKRAVQIALDFVRDLYEGQDIHNLALEEVKLSEDESYWIVTVGFQSLSGYVTVRGGSPFSAFEASSEVRRTPRDLKEVHVDANTGEPMPMMIDRHIDV